MLQSSVRSAPNLAGTPVRLPSDTFLLNPDHADRMIGQSQLWSVFKKELFVFLLLLFLSGCMLLMSLQGLKPLLIGSQIQHSGVAVQADIVQKRTAAAAGRDQVSYFLKYHFTTLYGEQVHAEQAVNRSTYERFQTGDSAPVKYLPDEPTLSALNGSARDNLLDFGNMLIVLIGGIGFVAAFGSLVFLGWYLWREEHFFKRGQLVMGHVLACHGHLEVTQPSPEVEIRGPAPGGPYMINLSYAFHSATGKVIKSAAKRQRNDLCGCLPTFGQPVAVLYLDDQHYKIL